MIYESHLAAAQAGAWSLETDIPWGDIDASRAQEERDIQQALHDAALIEGYLPLYAAKLMQLVWDDVDATAVLSLELFEGLKHYTALTRYLDLVGFQPIRATEVRLVEARRNAMALSYHPDEIAAHLTNFTCSELFAAYFFARMATRTRELVLSRLLDHMARDEFRHSAAAGDILQQRVRSDPGQIPHVLAAAERFRHYGSDVVDVPVAEPNDFEAVMAMNRKIRAICGLTITEHLEEEMAHGDQ